jgi:plastocyanin
VFISLALLGAMVGMACMGGGHMGMMRRGNSGADQTPVVSDAEQVTVEMRNYEFFSARLTVNAGTEVMWVNRDSVPHNAVAEDGAFDTGNVNGGGTASIVMEQSGSYPYVCTYHPGMEGTLTVR